MSAEPMPGLDSEALDFRAASESFAGLRKLARRDRDRHFLDAWIQAGRFAGGDRSRILDRAEIRSLPVRAIEEAIAFVEKHSGPRGSRRTPLASG